MKQMERDKSQLIQDLQAQNQRLKTQLKEVWLTRFFIVYFLHDFLFFKSGKTEESLSTQLNSLRDQCNLKKSSLQDHESHLELMRDEVSVQKKLGSH